MPFQYTPRHSEEYRASGYTLLRGVIPASLLAELRRETETARHIARQRYGPQCERLQPVYTVEELNVQFFRDFLELPALRQAVTGCLGDDHETSEMMGVLIEPARDAWCTAWHRDWTHHVPGLNPHNFNEAVDNLRLLNRLNAALYADHSLWVVPGSHCRADTEAERATFPDTAPTLPHFPPGTPQVERELACVAYVRKMPGGVQVHLEPGDVALYQSSLWHCGNYTPYAKRATLHDGFACVSDQDAQNQLRRKHDSQRLMPEPAS